jgi:hypothetical protein
MMSDRTVHATSIYTVVVRYERAGKWYIEDLLGPDRHPVSLAEAVRHVTAFWRHDVTIYFGRPGGRAFDAAVRRELARIEKEEQD